MGVNKNKTRVAAPQNVMRNFAALVKPIKIKKNARKKRKKKKR